MSADAENPLKEIEWHLSLAVYLSRLDRHLENKARSDYGTLQTKRSALRQQISALHSHRDKSPETHPADVFFQKAIKSAFLVREAGADFEHTDLRLAVRGSPEIHPTEERETLRGIFDSVNGRIESRLEPIFTQCEAFLSETYAPLLARIQGEENFLQLNDADKEQIEKEFQEAQAHLAYARQIWSRHRVWDQSALEELKPFDKNARSPLISYLEDLQPR